MPPKACVGDAVTLRCEVLVTANNVSELESAEFSRDGVEVTDRMELLDGTTVVGIEISNVSLDDDDVEYTCDTGGAPPDFESSVTLNIASAYILITLVFKNI